MENGKTEQGEKGIPFFPCFRINPTFSPQNVAISKSFPYFCGSTTIIHNFSDRKRFIMDTSKIVGEKIKTLRENQSISMEELAQRSGLAIEQIERIERNIDLPSLAPLIKIARVLGVRLGTFLDDQDENGPVVCRKDESQNSISFSNNAIQSRRHMVYHSLSKSKADRHMEPFIIDVAATNDSDFVLSSHEGEEFIMVMEGIMEISYGKNTYLLEQGDSIYYDSIVPHHVHAFEGKAAKILAVIYTPI